MSVSWTKQTKGTKLLIGFFEQVTKQSRAVTVDDKQASFNLCKEKVRDLKVFEESVNSLQEIRDRGETTMEGVEGNHLVATLKEIDNTIAHHRSTSTHFK